MRNSAVAVILVCGVISLAVHAREPVDKLNELLKAKPGTMKPGTYTSGKWTYTVKVTRPGTKSEGFHGTLAFDGKELHPQAETNDWLVTPWGKMYHMGPVKTPWGLHGWMRNPKPGSPAGKPLKVPAVGPAEMKIDVSRDGTYKSGPWTYSVVIKNKGTRSEGAYGSLTYHGEAIHTDAKTNDWLSTPWGKLYHMGPVKHVWGPHGWHPQPNKSFPPGKHLPQPK